MIATSRSASKHRPPAALLAFMLALVAPVAGCDETRPVSGTDGRLAPVPVAADSVTVSGLSSGGYMAVQMHVAYSTVFRGVGVFAAGPYYCARGSLAEALGRCMKGDAPIAADELVELTSRSALDGEIDPVVGQPGDRVYLFHGGKDALVAKAVVDALQSYYAALIAPTALKRVELAEAGHTFPSNDPQLAACGLTQSPFIGHCGLDGARQMLEHLYGALPASVAGAPAGELRKFDQRPYAQATDAVGLADEGFLYVPAACTGAGLPGRCRLHVALHGCKQDASFVGDAFVRRSGYLAAADAARIVVLFPQAKASLQPLNPNGCWDWWGYGGRDYATRHGGQVHAIKAMIDDLLGAAATETSTE